MSLVNLCSIVNARGLGGLATQQLLSLTSASGQANSERDLREPSPHAVNPLVAADAACAAMPH